MLPSIEPPSTVLVTGAAGFIGSHVAIECRKQWNATVIGIDSFNSYYDQSIKRDNALFLSRHGVSVLEADLADLSFNEIPSAEVIYHCAAQPGISETTSFEQYLHNNVVATHKLLEAVKTSATLELLVFVSTSSVYGMNATLSEDAVPAPASVYGVTKLAAEQMCLSYQRGGILPACSCRLYSVYGPRERPEKLVPRLLTTSSNGIAFPLFEGSDQHVRSFTYVADIVEGLMSVGVRRNGVVGKTYNLGSPQTSTTGEVIRLVESLLGEKINKQILPRRAGDQMSTAAVIDAAQSDLGYSAKTRLEDGLRRTIEWFQQHDSPNDFNS